MYRLDDLIEELESVRRQLGGNGNIGVELFVTLQEDDPDDKIGTVQGREKGKIRKKLNRHGAESFGKIEPTEVVRERGLVIIKGDNLG